MFTSKKEVQKDERTTVVENASYSLAYKFVGFALLFDVAYRAYVKSEASWDLLAIIIISGFLTISYQIRNKIVNRAWANTLILTITVASLVAFLIVLIRTIH
ncbi:MAG: hypothetical protein WC589_23880 [Sphingobacterium sp.]